MKARTAIIGMSLCAAGLFFCGNDNLAGNSSQEGNARGRLVKADGTPAAGAKVFFIPVDHNPSASPKILATWDSVSTDNQGYYGTTLDSGTYNMFAAQDTLSAYVDSIGVHQDTITLGTDTLRPSGSISGISFMPGQDAANQVRVTIYAPGTNLYTKPDVGGAFSFANVPEGAYRLIFDPTLDTYGVKVITVNVISGQTTDLDTVILYGQNLTGMPIPDAGNDTTVSISDTVRLHGSAKDSLGQIEKMEWGLAGGGAFAATTTGDTVIVAPNTATVIRYVLRVEDNDSNATTDTVRVNVIQDFPVANAGPDTALGRGDIVYLHGSKSTDQYGRIVKYEWDIGDTDSFSQCANGDTAFIAPDSFRFDGIPCVLRVTDDDRNTTSDTMLVFVGVFKQATSAAAFSPRSGHSSLVFDNKMWVIGGICNDTARNDVWCSSDGINWSLVKENITYNVGFSRRSGHTSVVFDNKMWVIGGNAYEYSTVVNRWGYFKKSDVWNSTDGVTWIEATDSAGFAPRSNHTSVVFNNKIWVIAGLTWGASGDIWCSSDGANWTVVAPMTAPAFPRRYEHSSVVFNNKMWVIGGLDDITPTNKDIWYSSDGATWTQGNDLSVLTAAHSSAAFDGKIWVIGGYDYSGFPVWYSSSGANWTKFSRTANMPGRTHHASVVFDNRIWIIGGNANINDQLGDVWFLN